jgi:hypothetical protein
VDERNVRQLDARLGRGAPVAVDRDVADRLERFVSKCVMFARDRIEVRVTGETGLERAIEISTPDAGQLVVEFDRDSGTWPITSRSNDVTSLLSGAKFAATYGAPVLFADGMISSVTLMVLSL